MTHPDAIQRANAALVEAIAQWAAVVIFPPLEKLVRDLNAAAATVATSYEASRLRASLATAKAPEPAPKPRPERWATPERDAILRRDWPQGRPIADIRADLEALPGRALPPNKVIGIRAASLGLKRPPGFNSAAQSILSPQPPSPVSLPAQPRPAAEFSPAVSSLGDVAKPPSSGAPKLTPPALSEPPAAFEPSPLKAALAEAVFLRSPRPPPFEPKAPVIAKVPAPQPANRRDALATVAAAIDRRATSHDPIAADMEQIRHWGGAARDAVL